MAISSIRDRCARCALAVLLVGCVALPAPAAEFPVTNRNDSGSGSLRDQVDAANLSPDPLNTISFSPSNLGTIALGSTLADITQPLRIRATGNPDDVLVRGANAEDGGFRVGLSFRSAEGAG